MKDSLFLRFLYCTIPGRILLRILVQPDISKAAARFLSSRYSTWLVPIFIRKNRINMRYYIVPDGGYRSFNDFFTRNLKNKYKIISTASLVSPCDGLLTIEKINKNSVFVIKNCRYRLSDLLQNAELAKSFENGTALIFRLTPSHYHRYNYCTTGKITACRQISGVLHCVRPVALEQEKVYIRNSREYIILDSECMGKVVQMEIGAMLVGKISNNSSSKVFNTVHAGFEKGCFEYGGSTIIILLDHEISLNKNIYNRPREEMEISVTIGEPLL